ncbi:MAG: thiamine pyrophosphate-binding protein, partial [Chloroflexota bacterium]|nr:thiamine pyrophosphate-binding protein [Chloroflexota bacterium]
MNCNQAIAHALKAEGTEYLFAFPHNPVIDACARIGIKPIIGRTERTVINMADGYSRLARRERIGVVAVQYGPGAENAFGGVAQGFADSTPFLVLTGSYRANRLDITPMFDAVPNYRAITKWAGQIATPDVTLDRVRRAFTLLRNGKSGPVLLQLPMDVGGREFPGDVDSYRPARRHRSMGDPADVAELVRRLLAAERPVIHAGAGVLYSDSSRRLVELAERLHIPVCVTLNGKSAFPEDHPLSLGVFAKANTLPACRFVSSADLVLGLGSSFSIANQQASLPAGADLIQVLDSEVDLQKDYPVAHAVVGDLDLVLGQVLAEVDGAHPSPRPDPRPQIKAAHAEWMAQWSDRFADRASPLSPYHVIGELMAAVDLDETIVTHDSGFPRDQTAPFWKSRPGGYYLGWGKSTQLGYGLGLALGAKMAAPDKTVINIMGDAAFGMAGLDIETAARSNIGTLTIILNNGVMTHYYDHFPHATE